jgi:hypothetical protein
LRKAAGLSSISSHSRDTWLLEMPLIPHRLHQRVDRAGRDALDVGFPDHRGQRLLGHPARLEEAGDRLFTFTRLPRSQWKSVRTTNAIERLHEEFKRQIKTQTVLPSAETAAMLFWALLAAGQITMRKVDGWQSLALKLAVKPIDLVA